MVLSETIQLYREEVMQMTELLKTRRYKGMHGEGRRPTSTTIFADVFYTQERLLDYCDIIADSLIKYNRMAFGKTFPAPEQVENARRHVHELFKDKYEILKLGEDEEGHMIDLLE